MVPRIVLDDFAVGDDLFKLVTAQAPRDPLLSGMDSVPISAVGYCPRDVSHFLVQLVGHVVGVFLTIARHERLGFVRPRL